MQLKPTKTLFNKLSEPFDLQQIKAVFIDLDGTLIDHFKALYRCYQYACETLELPVPSIETVQRSVGGSMPVTIQKFVPQESLEKGMALWRERFDAIHLEDVEIMAGGLELLKTLHAQNIRAAVLTNKSGDHSRGIMNDQGLNRYLAFTLGAEDTPFRKPDAQIAKIALERVSASAEQAVMIGDSPFDIETALNSGMTCFAVPTGSHNAEELQAAGAHCVYPDLIAIEEDFARLAMA